MKVEVQNKKGLTTTLSIIVDKKIIQEKLDKKLSELQSEVSLKGLDQVKSHLLLLKVNLEKLYTEKLLIRYYKKLQTRL